MTGTSATTSTPTLVLTEVLDKPICFGAETFSISKYFNKSGGQTDRGGVAKVWVSDGFNRVFAGKIERDVVACGVHMRQLLDTLSFTELCEQLKRQPHELAIRFCHVYRYMRFVYQKRHVPKAFCCFIQDQNVVWPLDVTWDRHRWCLTLDDLFWDGREWQTTFGGITRSEEATGWYRGRVLLHHE